jgi:hypothetical protein
MDPRVKPAGDGNRMATSWDAEKLSTPYFVATKPRPQVTEVRAARNMSRSVNGAPLTISGA